MAMPNDLVFVRHGQSEANIIQGADKAGTPHVLADEVFDRPDWQQRLSSRGVEQAKAAGQWIRENLGGVESFDFKYFSPFARTRETAAHLGGPECMGWIHDDRLVERSWGVFGSVPKDIRESQFALTAKMYRRSPWYMKLDGGESRYDVSARFRNFQETLHREAMDQRVLVVTHGDFIGVARYNIERMLPEEFDRMDKDRTQEIKNCAIVHYTRVNPLDPSDVRRKIAWRRIVNPTDLHTSPFGGEWMAIGERRQFSGADLMKQADSISHRLIDSDYAPA